MQNCACVDAGLGGLQSHTNHLGCALKDSQRNAGRRSDARTRLEAESIVYVRILALSVRYAAHSAPSRAETVRVVWLCSHDTSQQQGTVEANAHEKSITANRL